MPITAKQKKLLGLGSIALFLLAFSGLIWFGYRQFYFYKDNKTLIPSTTALNTQLPKVDSTKDMNKLEIYQLKEKDSLKKLEQQAYDPYSKPIKSIAEDEPVVATRRFTLGRQKETKQQSIETRLNRIYQSFDRTTEPAPALSLPKYEIAKDTIAVAPPDPQMKQLETMLDKLIDIQHPELVKARAKKVDTSGRQPSNIFDKTKSVLAVVHQTQVLTGGGTIKLRLLQDLQTKTILIPKGNFLFGTCSIANERLTVQLTNATYQNQVYPVSLNVYDVDGIEGIYVPGAISREVSKDGADQGIQSFNLSGYEATIASQAASAGIQTAKSLLSKKVRMVRVTVKAGHHILLQPANAF